MNYENITTMNPVEGNCKPERTIKDIVGDSRMVALETRALISQLNAFLFNLREVDNPKDRQIECLDDALNACFDTVVENAKELKQILDRLGA